MSAGVTVRPAGLREKPARVVLNALPALGTCGAVLLVTWLIGDSFFEQRPIRFFFDHIDPSVYFRESEWGLTSGKLPYRDLFSEYPPIAVLVFKFVRLISTRLVVFQDPFHNFCWWWMGLAGLGYGFAAGKFAREGWLPLFTWLSPAALYFALFRFDLYPALASLMALLALRNERYVRAAAWLGLCIALKGYAAVFLPALSVFWIYRVGLKKAVALSVLAIAPMVVSLGLVWLYAGTEGVLMPFEFHAGRGYNGETIYLAVDNLLDGRLEPQLDWMLEHRVPLAIQVAFGLLAAALRPRTFDQLLHAFLIAVVGFVTFSVFHSPQFALWIIVAAAFTTNRYLQVLLTALSWFTYLYFPIVFDWSVLPDAPAHIIGYQEASILVLVVLKLLIMLRRKPAGEPLPQEAR
jgi:hypothetical protein